MRTRATQSVVLRVRDTRAKPGRYVVEVLSPRGETLRFPLVARR